MRTWPSDQQKVPKKITDLDSCRATNICEYLSKMKKTREKCAYTQREILKENK